MLKRNLLFVLLTLFASNILLAQSENDPLLPGFNLKEVKKTDNLALSGNLTIDNKISFDAVSKEMSSRILNPQFMDKKSPWLGALFSFILPGAGEFYAGSYWKAGIFAALEAAVITTAIIYNNKGNDATDNFEKFANSHWDAVRYAKWLIDVYGPSQGVTCNIDLNQVANGDYTQIHECENQFPALSHNLAPFGDQQYYEMIGKYDQFASGWDDFDPNQPTTTPISPNFRHYSGLRGDANNYYSVASTAVIGIYINHFLSAIDAYWSTTIYNKKLIVSMKVKNQRFADTIELVPTVNLKFSF